MCGEGPLPLIIMSRRLATSAASRCISERSWKFSVCRSNRECADLWWWW